MMPVRALAGITWAALAALFLFACGGGSAPVTGTIVPAKPRAGLHMGYFSNCRTFMLEQPDHTDIWWARGWCSADQNAPWHLRVAQELSDARGAGYKNIVLHLDTEDPTELRFHLGKLSEGGWLVGWDSITVYKWDEPNMPAGGNLSDQDVTERVQRVRQVMFDTPGLIAAKVGVFYACANGAKPGIKSFDLVGCFRYGGDGCPRLETDYAGLRSLKAFTAKLWLIPSGADINGKEGQQDPACWASYAHRFEDVWGVIAFMWQSGADPNNHITGIRDIPLMRRLYCEMGRVILKPDEQPRC